MACWRRSLSREILYFPQNNPKVQLPSFLHGNVLAPSLKLAPDFTPTSAAVGPLTILHFNNNAGSGQ